MHQVERFPYTIEIGYDTLVDIVNPRIAVMLQSVPGVGKTMVGLAALTGRLLRDGARVVVLQAPWLETAERIARTIHAFDERLRGERILVTSDASEAFETTDARVILVPRRHSDVVEAARLAAEHPGEAAALLYINAYASGPEEASGIPVMHEVSGVKVYTPAARLHAALAATVDKVAVMVDDITSAASTWILGALSRIGYDKVAYGGSVTFPEDTYVLVAGHIPGQVLGAKTLPSDIIGRYILLVAKAPPLDRLYKTLVAMHGGEVDWLAYAFVRDAAYDRYVEDPSMFTVPDSIASYNDIKVIIPRSFEAGARLPWTLPYLRERHGTDYADFERFLAMHRDPVYVAAVAGLWGPELAARLAAYVEEVRRLPDPARALERPEEAARIVEEPLPWPIVFAQVLGGHVKRLYERGDKRVVERLCRLLEVLFDRAGRGAREAARAVYEVVSSVEVVAERRDAYTMSLVMSVSSGSRKVKTTLRSLMYQCPGCREVVKRAAGSA